MIEAAVSRGIRDMSEDPERSVRRLADLGRQFSANRFQSQIFSVIQELLDNENSAYYDMVHNLLKNSDEETLKRFGINFGYMSWTFGARILRKKQEELGFCLPWSMRLRYDAQNPDRFTVKELSSIIQQGQELGIYAYFIRETGNSSETYELLDLIEHYKDSAFVWLRNSGRLTAAQIQMLKVCKNTVVSLPVEDPESFLTAALLRDQKVVYAFHYSYDGSTGIDDFPVIFDRLIAIESPIFFAVAKDNSDVSAAAQCYQSRLDQKFPFLTLDYYGDGVSISKVIAEHPYLFEVGEDKRVLLPDGSKGAKIDAATPLVEIFKQCMPAYSTSKE